MSILLWAMALSTSSLLETGYKPTVVDGSTLALAGSTYRLRGVVAPPLSQICEDRKEIGYRCGKNAKRYLEGLVKPRTVKCVLGANKTVDCRNGDRRLSELMVEAGWAVVDYNIDDGDLIAAQERAKSVRRGIWAGPSADPRSQRSPVTDVDNIIVTVPNP